MLPFENRMRAMDVNDILIQKASDSKWFYYTYKGKFSVVLIVIVTDYYELLYVHSGTKRMCIRCGHFEQNRL